VTTASRPQQHRRLIRTADLAGFRNALIGLAWAGDPVQARRRILILPTRASIELFRQTIEAAAAREGRATVVLPDLVTRDGLLTRLLEALPGAPPLLTRLAREALLERAARSAANRARMPGQPFDIRPGLVGQMLDLYDEIQRRQRTIGRFTRALFDQLRVERGTDRGSESLIHQTCFLGFAFLGYERDVDGSGGLDEHHLRRRLLEANPALPFDEVVVAVADNPTDPRGLWPADFDLLGRLRHLRHLDVLVTDDTHDAGFRERMEQELPGIEEVRPDAERRAPPVRVGPVTEAGAPACTSSRDREEELREVAREIRHRALESDHAIVEPTAIVFQRPLPYLYLAPNVLADAGVPFQAFDALPLAAEPYAALLDLVLAAARTGGTRAASVALLRSPLLRFVVDGTTVDRADAAALDAVLVERRANGEADTYPDEVDAFFGGKPARDRMDAGRARRGARGSVIIRDALEDYRNGETPSGQVAAVSGFLRRFESPAVESDERDRRFLRARAAVLGVLDDLARAFATHDNGRRRHEDVTAAIHHAIETHTVSLEREHGGVHLVDAVAARFGEFDHVHVVGFVEADWPERPRRSIFYGGALLTSLGWPEDRDRTRAEHAAFRDLLKLAGRTLQLHAFQVEGDALAAVSPMIEMARSLSTRESSRSPSRVFADEVLTVDPPLSAGLDSDQAAWLRNRVIRPPLDDPRYSGQVEAQSPIAYRISRVDRYVACPFKYFSETVLGLPEERDEQAGLTPLERGNLVHELFEQFYRAWTTERRGTITPEALPAALDLFRQLTRAALARLPGPDRALEEARLLGSIVARGVAERVFELEADAGGVIVDRLIEHDLRGPFVFPHGFSPKTIQIRGKADRIDVFDDGSLRVIDYKLGRPPDLSTTIQIAVYAHCMKLTLEARDGKPHAVVSASYLAFGDEKNFEGALASRGKVPMEVETRAQEFADVIGRIEAGTFAPGPKKPSDCQWCRYAGVCRKEYLVEDDAAEPV
jgi:RecB family exonuclease